LIYRDFNSGKRGGKHAPAPKSFHGHRRPRLYRKSEHNMVETGLIEKVYEEMKKED